MEECLGFVEQPKPHVLFLVQHLLVLFLISPGLAGAWQLSPYWKGLFRSALFFHPLGLQLFEFLSLLFG